MLSLDPLQNYLSVWYSHHMKTPLTFLLSLTFLFLFSGSVYGDDFQDGLDAYQKQDYKEALRLFRLSAEQGYALGQFKSGLMYEKGQGVPKDYKEAFKWYRLSAEQGFAEAQYNLGVLHYHGRGVLQDHEEAAKWWKLAAEQKLEIAQWNLEVMHGNSLN